MRFKIFACILLILSIFSFVLAAPLPGLEVREACADAAEGGEGVIIASGKRATKGTERPESDLYPPDLSDTESAPSPHSPSAHDYASGSHPGVDMHTSLSGGSESPPPRLFTQVWSIPGETEASLDPEGGPKTGATTENQPESSGKTKKVNFYHTTKVHIFEPDLPPPPEDQLASSSATKSVSWGTVNKAVLPSGEITSEVLPPEVEHLPPPPGRERYRAKMAGQLSLPEIEHASPSSYLGPPQSKGFVNDFKTYLDKLGKLKFRPRFQRRVDIGA